ncbi:nicotinate (nicotinamide) nucleotide adenylyltransferase [Hyphomicrobiales bacterium]|nr:nicotinate (nicotinamide) nucleotide adenylyltransferase [Hyphomicrobiales bacterium]
MLLNEIIIPKNSKVGLFGGSFNPAHEWHFQVANEACKSLDLDLVIWLVSPHNPLKDKNILMPLHERLESAKNIANSPKFLVTDIEKTIKTQYSSDTVRIFQETYPTEKFIWIMGSDNAAQIDEWKNWKEFISKIPLAIYPRATNPLSDVEQRLRKYAKKIDEKNSKDLINEETPCFTFINGPMNDISSTRIRREM